MSTESASTVYSATTALCPTCKKKVTGKVTGEGNKIYLEKFCSEHGHSRTLISTDRKWYEDSRNFVKPRQLPIGTAVKEFKGCPDSCGFCPEHQQHSCLPVIEILSGCDLNCPICLKNFDKQYALSLNEFKSIIDRLFEFEERIDVVNLSGGEPTLHPELGHFFEYAARKGVVQTTVSTHGLSLLKDKSLRDLFKKYNAIAAIQFDGFHPDSWHFLRGHDYSKEKLELIRILEEEAISYSLVATVAKGVNDFEITAITDFFFEHKALSLMFQPIAFTGQAEALDGTKHRLTIPDVVKRAEESRFMKSGDFNPLPCSHYSCFALSYYLSAGQGRFVSLKEFLGADKYLDMIANRTLPGLDSTGSTLFRDRLYELWSAADSSASNEQILKRIKSVLQAMNGSNFTPQKALSLGMESMKAVFIHHFMDHYNLDFNRLIKCCNPYPQADGRLVPICSQNIFKPH